MNINTIQSFKPSSSQNILSKVKPTTGLRPQLGVDTVTFRGKTTPFLFDIVNDLSRSTSNKDWQKVRKGDTKDTNVRVLSHPEYGKVKTGLTLAYREDLDFDISGQRLKAFIEIPKLHKTASTTNEESQIFQLAKRVVGNDSYTRLKKRAEREEELTLKRYDRMCEQYCKPKKRKSFLA